MKRLFPMAASLALVLAAGCAHVDHNAEDATVPISMSSQLGRDYQKVSEFHVSEKKGYLFWGLLPLSDLNGAQLAQEQINQSDGIVNLEINTSYDLLDWLLYLVTAGIISTQDIDVHGDLVTFRDRPTTVVVPPASQPNVIITPQN